MVLKVLWRRTVEMKNDSLEQIRKEIDAVDRELAALLEKRMDLAARVSEYKIKNNMEVLDASREARVIENVLGAVSNKEYHESVRAVFESIMAQSRKYQEKLMAGKNRKKYALIGGKLSHSISPAIHELIFQKANIDGTYELCEARQEELPGFLQKLREQGFHGVNVTIPYKTEIMKYLDDISGSAKAIGAVNTVVLGDRTEGYNTDYDGFGKTLEYHGFDPGGKVCAVLGSGGASMAAVSYLEDHGAAEIIIVSRNPGAASGKFPGKRIIALGDYTAEETDLIVNATPVGMYPETGVSPLDKHQLAGASFLFDLIYNPKETLLMKHARELGIPCCNGLFMLVAQAVSAQEIWQGINFSPDLIKEIYSKMSEGDVHFYSF